MKPDDLDDGRGWTPLKATAFAISLLPVVCVAMCGLLAAFGALKVAENVMGGRLSGDRSFVIAVDDNLISDQREE